MKLKAEPALIIGFITTVAGEVAAAVGNVPAHSQVFAYVLAALPIVSAAIIRFFVTPTSKP